MALKFFSLIVFLFLNSCNSTSQGFRYERLPVAIQTQSEQLLFQAELADTDEKQRQGLMNRQSLADDAGMLFVYPEETRPSFWMKNTYISLDMIFISKDKEIIYIAHQTTPLSLEIISPDILVQYVLEIKGGLARQQDIEVGDLVEFDL